MISKKPLYATKTNMMINDDMPVKKTIFHNSIQEFIF